MCVLNWLWTQRDGAVASIMPNTWSEGLLYSNHGAIYYTYGLTKAIPVPDTSLYHRHAIDTLARVRHNYTVMIKILYIT